jgi:hypothetical protein
MLSIDAVMLPMTSHEALWRAKERVFQWYKRKSPSIRKNWGTIFCICLVFWKSNFDSMHTCYTDLKPACENLAKVGPEDEAKEDAREDQVGNVVAVDTRDRNIARLETDRCRGRRQGRRRRRNDNKRADLEESRRGRHELEAKDVSNENKRGLRNDLIDDGLCTVTAHNDVTIGANRQDGENQLRNDESDDQKRKERLRARRSTNRLQKLASNLCGIGSGSLDNFGDRIINCLLVRTKRAHKGGHDLRTTGRTAKRSDTHLLELWENKKNLSDEI